ncbi:hypothetical protein [Nostoc sp.]
MHRCCTRATGASVSLLSRTGTANRSRASAGLWIGTGLCSRATASKKWNQHREGQQASRYHSLPLR